MLVFAFFEITEASDVLDARFRMLFVACVGPWQQLEKVSHEMQLALHIPGALEHLCLFSSYRM